MKHTPGPWRISDVRDVVIDSDFRTIATISWVRTGREPDITEEGSANVRLIAKAPEMYELLKRFQAGEHMACLTETRQLLKEIDND